MDLPGEKLLIKLWETLVEKGIGSLLSPWQTLREGRALTEVRRQDVLMLAQAELDVADIRAGRKYFDKHGSLLTFPNQELSTGESQVSSSGPLEQTLDFKKLADTARSTAAASNARSEINSTKAIIYAEEQLANDPQGAPERNVDEDWLFRWRDYAGGVSTEDLQRLWGSVLAGEVKSPGKYSLRTLDFLRSLSKEEAELIASVARVVIDGRIIRSVKGYPQEHGIVETYLEEHGISFSLLLKMQALGVMSGVESIGLSTNYKTLQKDKFLFSLLSNGKVLVIEHDDPTKTLPLDIYALTELGRQILGLGTFEPDMDYLRLIGKKIAAQGFSVKLGDFYPTSETEGHYLNAERIEP
jgi:Protein of unknown function (DUF2806)